MVTLQDAVRRLADVLAAENAALSVMDFAKAGALLAPKHSAADALAAALRAAGPGEKLDDALRELAALADENRHLLNRAMRVQRRVLDLVARAAKSGETSGRYASSGSLARHSATPRSLARRV